MRGSDPVVEVVRAWVAKAEDDLKTAAYLLRMEKGCPTDVVCFHSQQCVEKYLKALLAANGVEFPKTHDIEELISLLPRDLPVNLPVEEQRRLTGYATLSRYPGAGETASLAEARISLWLAQLVRGDARRCLPRRALRRVKRRQ